MKDITNFQQDSHIISPTDSAATKPPAFFALLQKAFLMLFGTILVASIAILPTALYGLFISYGAEFLSGFFVPQNVLYALSLIVIGVYLFRVLVAGESLWELNVKKSKESRARKRRAQDYPPPFPNGWYKLCESKSLAKGKFMEIECLGHQFLVFRGEDGIVGVLDAICPHLGANLAEGGRVVGNCMECPFHGWRFSTDGKCTHIPYSDNIPEFAKTKSWPIKEVNNMICLYFDAEGREPAYFPIEIPEIKSGEYIRYGFYDQCINFHIQEFAENSADYQHFAPLHGNMFIPFTAIKIPFIKINHTAAWEPSPKGQEHLAVFRDTAYLEFNGHKIPRTDASAEITFDGPAGIVIFKFFTPLGNIYMFETHLPLEPLKQRVEIVWYADKKMSTMLVGYVVGNWISQLRNDIQVWENKAFLSKPMLMKNDGPVMQLRRWYSQFYSENSTKVSKKGSLEW